MNQGNVKISVPKFNCPVHGVVETVITSTIQGHEGNWCQVCWIDSFAKLGIERVTRIEEDANG